MKNIIFGSCLTVAAIFAMSACSVFEEPNPFDQNNTPVTSIAFNGTDLNIASVTTVETNRITITANLSGTDVTSVSVNSRFRDLESIGGVTAQRSRTLATLTPTNQQVVFTDLVRNMGSTPDAGTPRAGQAIVLEFVATGAGKTTTRRFTVNLSAPIALLPTRNAVSALTTVRSMNPTTISPNQLVRLGFTASGTAAGQHLTKIEVFRKFGFNGTEEVAPVLSKNYPGTAATLTDSLDYTLPSNAVAGDSIYLRYFGTFANGQTFSVIPPNRGTPRFNVVNNALQDLRSALVFSAGANSSYNMATVTFNGAGTDETVKDLIFDNVAMSLRSGMGSNTNFVLAPSNFNFGTASLQTANTAYMAGTSSTSISGLLVGQTYVCLIRNGTGIDRYGVFRIVGVAPNATAAQSTVTIDFRSLRP